MNAVTRCAPALMLVLLSAAPVMAAPTREHIRALHRELDQLNAQVDTLGAASSVESDKRDVASHLALVEQHLRNVGAEICGKCEHERLVASAYRAAAEACEESGKVVSSLTPQNYAKVMQKEMHKMHDHLSAMSHEKSPWERQRLLRGYYRHVLQALKRGRPTCESER